MRSPGVSFMKKTTLIVLGALVVVIGGIVWYRQSHPAAVQLISVTRGSIAETVTVTGNTTPSQSVSIGFQNTGTIAAVHAALGDAVNAGEVIAELNTANLLASLQQAQADVAVQQAKLAGLKAGAQPADIAASEAALQKAQQDLANYYASISDSSASGFAKANDAVRTQLDTFFSNAETSQPQLNFQTSNPQAATAVTDLRYTAALELNAWQNELVTTNPGLATTTLKTILVRDLVHLSVAQNLLNTMSAVLAGSINLSSAQLAADKAAVTAGLTEVNAAISALNTISQNIASQEALVAQTQAQLALKQAGSTEQDIAAQQAQVDQAVAGVASAQANLQNAEIVAPIAGVLTQQDAKVGQVVVAGAPLVSIMGSEGLEVDAGVAETDVGKLAIGNVATMTLDAFPNETFTGKVFYIAPSQTNNQGVITYQIKIPFTKQDPRIKSGLTANITIETQHKDNVLILPQYALLQNDQGTFVETMQNNTVIQVPVATGIQDENGNVEMLSGVTEGEQVLNIGLKTQ